MLRRFTLLAGVVVLGSSLVAAQEKTEKSEKADQPKQAAKLLGAPVMPPEIMASANNVRPTRAWVDADYLLWWTKNMSSPPLAVTGATPVLAGPTFTAAPIPTSPGFIGLFTVSSTASLSVDNATGTLLGGHIHDPAGSGGRFTIGSWLDDDGCTGVEIRYLYMRSSTNFSPSGVPVVGMPYQTDQGAETAYMVNQPQAFTSYTKVFVNTTPAVFVHLFDAANIDAFGGTLNVHSTSTLQGVDANAVWNLGRSSCGRLEAIAGFRFLELDETLRIESNVIQSHVDSIVYDPALGLPTGKIPVVNQFTSATNRIDNFDTRNSFFGGQIGMRGSYGWGRLSITAGAQIGLGVMHEVVNIDGATNLAVSRTTTPTASILLAGIPLTVATGAAAQTATQSNSTRGGLYAQPTNIGSYTRNVFAVVPEGVLKLNYRFTDRLSGNVGYTFLYASSVARPGDQINHTVNPSLLATPPTASGPTQPVFQFRGTDYWAQGINFGLELRY